MADSVVLIVSAFLAWKLFQLNTYVFNHAMRLTGVGDYKTRPGWSTFEVYFYLMNFLVFLTYMQLGAEFLLFAREKGFLFIFNLSFSRWAILLLVLPFTLVIRLLIANLALLLGSILPRAR